MRMRFEALTGMATRTALCSNEVKTAVQASPVVAFSEHVIDVVVSQVGKSTGNIVGTADDRKISGYGVGGSAKAAGTLAATARAIRIAIA